MFKKFVIIFLITMLIIPTACTKAVEIKPFMITMVSGSNEKSLMETMEAIYENDFSINYWFNGELDINDNSIEKYLSINPESTKPNIQIINSKDSNTARICVQFEVIRGYPDEIQLVLKKGIKDKTGGILKEDMTINVRKPTHILESITLANDESITSKTGYDFNSYFLDNNDKVFKIKFREPMDRDSVESAFSDGFRYVEKEFLPKYSISWSNDTNLLIEFSNMTEGQMYPISFNGAKTQKGEEYKEYELNKVFGFFTQKSQEILKTNSKGDTISKFIVPDEILEIDKISPDDKYAFSYRVLENGSQFYAVKPILLEFNGSEVKKHFIEGLDYIDSIHFGMDWFKNSKGFIFNDYKNIYMYEIKNLQINELLKYELGQNDYLLGAKISPNGDRIAYFKSEYRDFEDKDYGKTDLHIIDLKGNIINKVKDVFYHNGADDYFIPLQFDWKDNDNIISEGFIKNESKTDTATYDYYSTVIDGNVYNINVLTNKVDLLFENAANPSILEDLLIVSSTKWNENGYLDYYGGKIIDIKNINTIYNIEGNLSYSAFSDGLGTLAYELYDYDFFTYIFDIEQKRIINKIEGKLFGTGGGAYYIIK